MSLSVVAMGFAAAGLLTPVVGAFAQEIIDAGVILNAMRALGGGHDSGTRSTGLGNLQVPEEEEDARRLAPR
jgi:hypothetical protein